MTRATVCLTRLQLDLNVQLSEKLTDCLKLQEFLSEIQAVLKAVLVLQMNSVDTYLANALVSLHWIFITVAESSPIAG